jgi:pimeloyl-ACP methyl ester carboxylesterase
VRSQHEDALPLIMTHGWPGSVIELLETVGPLTDPTAHGGQAEDAFHLVLPSLPGYGFSGEPTELGWESGRIARAWAELMDRLGYTRYVAPLGDVGALVTDAMGRQAPEGLLGIYLNLLAGAIGLKDQLPAESEQERAGHDAINTFTTSGFGYFLEQSTRPQTIGYALLDLPVGLAASRFRPASRRSPARSGLPHAAGSRRSTPTSATSTRSTRAATSPHGKSPNCSRRRSERRSDHCASRREVLFTEVTLL